MTLTTIYFDESGNTGTELLDVQQPYFTTGSTDIPEDEAADIIKRCFPRHKGPELKSKEIFKRRQGRQAFLAFAKEVGQRPERFVATKINKRFTVLCKMVDHLVEPLWYAKGYDFYKGDYAARYANTAYFAFTNFLDQDAVTAVLTAFNDFARFPEANLLNALRTTLKNVEMNAHEGAKIFLEPMIEGTARLDGTDLKSLADTNDIHVTSLVSSMGHWQSRHGGAFAVVHDESMHFFSRSERWAAMTDPNHPPQVIHVGEKTLTLPISVVSTTSALSHQCPSLQLCDLVAGFVSRIHASSNAEFQAFVPDAVKAGIGEMSIYPVDAGKGIVNGPPSIADGPDAIDRIRMSIAATGRPFK
ncbi:DUF3800 domain-containing protein [Mesorhizobium sp. ES1-1]|uniref:DUF3800 domain-containing protein n=1 Tax=Mesorhizobium sp. ES1-1 TaxID=2876629 RepID=UPI001CCDB386|nr:DUF3800 domain-containing protein [Mesorhizobium sp. ES1-1]MBZ9678240.1 DUF3800 domain-containing protein [Mesorhizobium sp. ES1-1]